MPQIIFECPHINTHTHPKFVKFILLYFVCHWLCPWEHHSPSLHLSWFLFFFWIIFKVVQIWIAKYKWNICVHCYRLRKVPYHGFVKSCNYFYDESRCYAVISLVETEKNNTQLCPRGNINCKLSSLFSIQF